MIKVLIVDDEYLQREMVKNSADWESMGMIVAGEAEDGRMALKLSKEVRPDIIIMDINIPFLNGIEASTQIREFLPEVQIIILTAYGEFDYAKQALEFGAVGYVLKPLDPAELYKKLIQAKEKLENIWAQRDNLLELQKENYQKEKEQFLIGCLSGLQENGDKMSKWRKYEILEPKCFSLLEIRYANAAVMEENRYDIKEYIEERFPDCETICINRDILFLLLSEEKSEQYTFDVQALCMHLKGEMGEFSIERGSISEIHENMEELHIAYQEAYAALRNGESKKEIEKYETQTVSSLLKALSYSSQDLIIKLRAKNYDGALNQVHDCFHKLASLKDPYQSMQYIGMDILVNFALYMMDLGIDTSGKLEGERELMVKVSSGKQIKEVEELICSTLKSGFTLIENHSFSAGKRKVEDAKKFILNHYQNYDLSLNMVAEEIGVNPSYLSYIFKKEYGFSLSRYVIQVRMEQAKRLIESDTKERLSVLELAGKVGYTDEYYFSKSFKNYYGISPSKWGR